MTPNIIGGVNTFLTTKLVVGKVEKRSDLDWDAIFEFLIKLKQSSKITYHTST